MVQDRTNATLDIDAEFQVLLAAAQGGDEQAIGALWRAHNPRLLRFLRSAEAGEADDIASDTWIAAARNLGGFDGDEDAFRGWLFTIARCRLIDHRRFRARRHAIPVAEPQPADAAASAESDAMAELGGDAAARRIVAMLPADQAEIILLRVVADLPVAQVAEIVEKSPGAVRVLQHRALRKLAAVLGDAAGEL